MATSKNATAVAVATVLPLAVLLAPASALAQTAPAAPIAPAALGQSTTDAPGTAPAAPQAADPTGGAYTTPTLLFIPAAAVPTLNVRVIPSATVQSPSDSNAGFRPGIGAELGASHGLTFGAGTNWVGGDVSKTDFNQGLSPYLQARFHIAGRDDGMGVQLGTAATYKFVGFEGDPGEMELSLSLQYRQHSYELGLQGVMGQDFGDSNHHDGEVHTYAVYRVIPQLALGGAGQVRMAIAPVPGAPASTYDVLGGGIASLTLGRYQIAGLGGASTLGLVQGHAGALGQVFGSVRF
ncbi:MAG TPA: hypothetical protein VIF15_07855 [Polyangiaceae bacterium]